MVNWKEELKDFKNWLNSEESRVGGISDWESKLNDYGVLVSNWDRKKELLFSKGTRLKLIPITARINEENKTYGFSENVDEEKKYMVVWGGDFELERLSEEDEVRYQQLEILEKQTSLQVELGTKKVEKLETSIEVLK